MNGTVGNPVLLSEWGGRVNDKLLSGRIIVRRCFHLDGIITIAEFSKCKAAHIGERIDAIE